MVWRDPDTLQIGIDPRRAVALRGMRGAEPLINLLDGSRDLHQVLAAAHDEGISPRAAERVIGLLAAAGALHDFPAATLRSLPDGPRNRLARELATVSLAYGYSDGGALVLARRQAASVRVHGTGPVAAGLASLLTASGVGQVTCTGPVGEPSGAQASAGPAGTASADRARLRTGGSAGPASTASAGPAARHPRDPPARRPRTRRHGVRGFRRHGIRGRPRLAPWPPAAGSGSATTAPTRRRGHGGHRREHGGHRRERGGHRRERAGRTWPCSPTATRRSYRAPC